MLRALNCCSVPTTDRLQISISIFLILSNYYCFTLDSLFANVQKAEFSHVAYAAHSFIFVLSS